jgi:hypothetical protein
VAGIILGCVLGLAVGTYYAWQVNPAIYAGGAFPNELASGYQANYLDVVIDSYIVNRQVESAQERLQTFDPATKIRALGRRSAEYAAVGRAVEAQAVNDLAVALRTNENWPPETIAAEVGQLATEFQGDPAKAQAINNTFGAALNVVPGPTQPGETAQQPTPAPATPPAEGGGIPLLNWIIGCILLVLVIVGAILLAGRWQQQQSGMGILEVIPGTSPKQVVAFDVGLFDKTDITTLSRVVMSESAYNDPNLRAKIEANPQAEAVLARPGTEFDLETSAMRVKAKIEEMEYGQGDGGRVYFNRLKLSLAVFVREGADLRIGTMDVPDQYRNHKRSDRDPALWLFLAHWSGGSPAS